MEAIATIDVGSNSILLLVARLSEEGRVEVLHNEARITRLGEGMGQNKKLTKEAMERTVAVLKEYAEICQRARVKNVTAVGTAACRRAENIQDFIKRVAQETGLEIQVISGEREAYLSYLSVQKEFANSYSKIVACDIGGGSTELIWQQHILSLPIGCVDLLEEFIRHDPPSDEEIGKMRVAIRKKLDVGLLDNLLITGPWTLIGLSGTCTTLAAINQRLPQYDAGRVHASKLHLVELSQMTDFLSHLPLETRKQISGLDPGRADTIIPGAIILEEILNKIHSKMVVVSDHGVRYGLFWKKIEEI